MPICRECQVGFTNWTQYNAHLVRRHGGKDKYTCPIEGCNKEFKTLSSYKTHEYYHQEDKKHFQCKWIPCTVAGCMKAFPTKVYLKEHMNTKHGDPYECQHVLDGCKFTCKSHKTLNDHHKYYCPFNLDRPDANGNAK